VNVKPPAIMPKEMPKASPDNQAPIIPPTAMLASNQRNQIASLKPGLTVRAGGTIVASVTIVGSAEFTLDRPCYEPMTSSLSTGFSMRPQRNYTLNRKRQELWHRNAAPAGVGLQRSGRPDTASRYPGLCSVGASEEPEPFLPICPTACPTAQLRNSAAAASIGLLHEASTPSVSRGPVRPSRIARNKEPNLA
jgi:hypothetical protein